MSNSEEWLYLSQLDSKRKDAASTSRILYCCCQNCGNVNSHSCHWCIECGTVLNKDPNRANTLENEYTLNIRNKPYVSLLKRMHLLYLPDELLLLILSFLSLVEIALCRCTCKRLYLLSFDKTLYGKEMVLTTLLTSEMIHQVSLLPPSSLVLKRCKFETFSCDINNCINTIGKSLKNITIDTCNMGPASCDILLNSVANYCLSLTSVKLHWINVDGDCILKLSENCHKLKVLSLQNVSGISAKAWKKIITTLSWNCTDLSTLNIKLCPELSLAVLFPFDLLQCMVSLKILRLTQNFYKIRLCDIHSLVSLAPHLSTLSIESVKISQEIINYIKKVNINFQVQGLQHHHIN